MEKTRSGWLDDRVCRYLFRRVSEEMRNENTQEENTITRQPRDSRAAGKDRRADSQGQDQARTCSAGTFPEMRHRGASDLHDWKRIELHAEDPPEGAKRVTRQDIDINKSTDILI